MEKAKYTTPETEIIEFTARDIIVTSTLESDELIKMPTSV